MIFGFFCLQNTGCEVSFEIHLSETTPTLNRYASLHYRNCKVKITDLLWEFSMCNFICRTVSHAKLHCIGQLLYLSGYKTGVLSL